MEGFMLGVVMAGGMAVAAVALAFLCAFGRKKTALPQTELSSDPTDVTVEETRKTFSFDDPYHSIDVSDDVKTLSSAGSGDSAFERSPNDSGQSIQGNSPNNESGTGDSGSGPHTDSSSSPTNNSDGQPVADEAVYEMIAFEHDGAVNHNPSPDAVTSSLRPECDVSDQSLQTYEDVEGGDLNPDHRPAQPLPDSREEAAEVVRRDSATATAEENDDVFEDVEEPVYSAVYESLYVDCMSSSHDRKDSGVVLEMASSPTPTTAPVMNRFCKLRNSSAPVLQGDVVKERNAGISRTESVHIPMHGDMLKGRNAGISRTESVHIPLHGDMLKGRNAGISRTESVHIPMHGDMLKGRNAGISRTESVHIPTAVPGPTDNNWASIKARVSELKRLKSMTPVPISTTSPDDSARAARVPILATRQDSHMSSDAGCGGCFQDSPQSPRSDAMSDSALGSPGWSPMRSMDTSSTCNTPRSGSNPKPTVPPKPPRKKNKKSSAKGRKF